MFSLKKLITTKCPLFVDLGIWVQSVGRLFVTSADAPMTVIIKRSMKLKSRSTCESLFDCKKENKYSWQ